MRSPIASTENPMLINGETALWRNKSKRLDFLRHSHASMLIEMGFAPLEIADRLGHESVKTTLDTYSHLYPDKDQQLADRLNQFRRAVPPEEEFS